VTKYGAIRTEVDGITFDSKRESRRWSELRLLERAGEIVGLERQVEYPLSVAGIVIGKIKPDFRYSRAGLVVVEDVKSKPTMTPLFRWKAKHLAAEYGVKLELVL
jgi:hypothetical protein